MKSNKVKFEKYNSGVIICGEYVESYDKSGNACKEKEFVQKGKFFFSYKSIREQDKLKYEDTGKRVSIKMKIPFNNIIKTNDTILLNNELYSIAYLEPDNSKESIYIYLTELMNILSKHIDIYIKKDVGVLEDDIFNHLKTVWGDVEEIVSARITESTKDDKVSLSSEKKFTIRYLEQLDISNYKNVSVKYKIKYKNNLYNIKNITNIKEKNKLLEIVAVIE